MIEKVVHNKPASEAEALIKYEPLVHRMAKNFYRRYSHYHSYEDLLQVANIAVISAYRNFSGERSSFITHVYNTVRFAISKLIQRHTGLIHVPYKRVTSGATIPSFVDIENHTPSDYSSTFHEDVDTEMLFSTITNVLTELEMKVVTMIYRDSKSMFDIATALDMTRNEVSNVHKAAIAKLKEACSEHELSPSDFRSGLQ